ncbi:MAG: hypothetical protein KF841_08960 [Phycisphaerae bacterium]|nr:hypothetical protein [Phycisphaerae bacterium]
MTRKKIPQRLEREYLPANQDIHRLNADTAAARQRRGNSSALLWVALAAVAAEKVETPTVQAGERQRMAISYLLAPSRPPPEYVRTVAVMDVGVECDEERRDARERKWQQIAADMIESMVQSGSNETGGNPAIGALRVVDRRSTRPILAEKDMQLVGIVEGDSAATAGKLLAVDALIMSRIKISIDYRRTRTTKVDWGGILGGGPAGPPRQYRSPYHRGPNNPYRARPMPVRGGPEFPRKTIEEICRDLTVQCSYTLVDARTGEALVRHTPPVFQKRDKSKPQFMFGSRMDAADLDPVDHFIGELIERASREFVSMIAPVRATYIYPVEIRGKDAEPAIRMMRADDYDGAIRVLERAYEKKQKETDLLFTLGLIHEMIGDRTRALDIYRQCVSARKVDEDKLETYIAAKDRLNAHMDRIIPIQDRRLSGGLLSASDDGDGNDKDKKKRKSKDKDDDDDD